MTRYVLVSMSDEDASDYEPITLVAIVRSALAGGMSCTVAEVNVPEMARALAETVDGGCGNCALQAAECVDEHSGGAGLVAAVDAYLNGRDE